MEDSAAFEDTNYDKFQWHMAQARTLVDLLELVEEGSKLEEMKPGTIMTVTRMIRENLEAVQAAAEAAFAEPSPIIHAA